MRKLLDRLPLSYALACLSGILMMLSMPGSDLWAFAWFGLVPLLLALPNKSSLHQYALINVAALIWSVGTHAWYPSVLSGWGYAVMIAGGLLYGGILKIGYDMSRRIRSPFSLFAVPVAFSVLEWAKTVIPWTKTWWVELVSKSQWTVPEQLQLLSVTGFIGLSFLIVLTNVVIANLLSRPFRGKAHLALSGVLLALPVLNYASGSALLHASEAKLAARPLTIGATVDLINQDPDVTALGNEAFAGDGYLADTPDMKQKIFDVNRELSRQIQAERHADIIVWGENEFMNLDGDAELYDQLAALAVELNASIVADAVWETDGAMYDTAVMMAADGTEIGRTRKIFTLGGEEEYGFAAGPREYATYPTAVGNVALAVCWDRHDPSILRNYAKNGARLALIPADDDFEGNRRFPYFAASDAVFRAVENRLAIGSGSTSGTAHVITPYGEVTAMSGVNERGFVAGDTFLTDEPSFYATHGDVFAYALTAVFAIMLAVSERNKRVRSSSDLY